MLPDTRKKHKKVEVNESEPDFCNGNEDEQQKNVGLPTVLFLTWRFQFCNNINYCGLRLAHLVRATRFQVFLLGMYIRICFFILPKIYKTSNLFLYILRKGFDIWS